MPRGGARNRSGPQADPSSGRSDRRGLSFTALPAHGFDGPVPECPLPPGIVWPTYWEGSGKDRVQVREDDTECTAQVAEREAELWSWAWRTPQAWAWAQPSESWRHPPIARWVGTNVLCEPSEAPAADKGSLHRFADQIGLTPAGLKENGWAIAKDELAAKAAERAEPQPRKSARDRMTMVSGGGS